MLRRILLLAILSSVASLSLSAQSGTGNVGNTILRRFAGVPTGTCGYNQVAVNNSNDDTYICDANTLMWVKIGSSGGGGTPGGAAGALQFNNAGAFGGVNQIKANQANCDGAGTPCDLLATQTNTLTYILAGTNTSAPVGNNFQIYQFTDGGLNFFDTPNGTTSALFSIDPVAGASAFEANDGFGRTGLKLETDQRLTSMGRFQFSTVYTTGALTSNFAANAGWGSTASVSSAGGSTNNFVMVITTGGAGIAANPQFTFTYPDGDASVGNSTVSYVCNQTGGNDIIADVTNTARNQTNEVFIWHGTPTTGDTYEISCFGAATN